MRRLDPERYAAQSAVESLETVLPPRLAVALRQAKLPFAFELLEDHDAAAGKRLYAAAMHDILDLSRKTIAHIYDYTNVHREIREGRKDWAHIGAWPWCLFGPTGKPLPDRHHARRSTAIAAVLATWATNRLRVQSDVWCAHVAKVNAPPYPVPLGVRRIFVHDLRREQRASAIRAVLAEAERNAATQRS